MSWFPCARGTGPPPRIHRSDFRLPRPSRFPCRTRERAANLPPPPPPHEPTVVPYRLPESVWTFRLNPFDYILIPDPKGKSKLWAKEVGKVCASELPPLEREEKRNLQVQLIFATNPRPRVPTEEGEATFKERLDHEEMKKAFARRVFANFAILLPLERLFSYFDFNFGTPTEERSKILFFHLLRELNDLYDLGVRSYLVDSNREEVLRRCRQAYELFHWMFVVLYYRLRPPGDYGAELMQTWLAYLKMDQIGKDRHALRVTNPGHEWIKGDLEARGIDYLAVDFEFLWKNFVIKLKTQSHDFLRKQPMSRFLRRKSAEEQQLKADIKKHNVQGQRIAIIYKR
ncbi:hypothetical protein JCM11641_004428 [Rhodosporidiobolus odoratus]